MTRALVAVLGLTAVLAGPAAAAGSDGVFGNFLPRPDAPAASASRNRGEAGVRERERESRLLRREHWERERARLISEASNGTVVAAR